MEFIMFSVNIYMLEPMDHYPKMGHDLFSKGSRPKNGYRPRRIDLFYRSLRIDPTTTKACQSFQCSYILRFVNLVLRRP